MGIPAPAGAAAVRIVAAGAVAAVAIVLLLLVRRDRPGGMDLAVGAVDDGAAPTARSTRPAATATATAPRWRPPKFTARQRERDRMVSVIRAHGLRDEAILKVMAAVPRHEFVPARLAGRAYDDRPLPIGYGQTISQPYIVAEMTRLLKLTPRSKVLEIGTGSAYQAAVLAHVTPHVYSIEIVKPLAASAAGRLKRLGYKVVRVRAGDGYYGWKSQAPFDAIVVTCAPGQIPPPLVRQLKRGGRMIIPVGRPYATQYLTLIEKRPDGKIRTRSVMPVAFVPMLGRARGK